MGTGFCVPAASGRVTGWGGAEQSQTSHEVPRNTNAADSVCLFALPVCVSVHLVTEPLDAFPVFLGDTRVGGFILHRGKRKYGKAAVAREASERVAQAGSGSDLTVPPAASGLVVQEAEMEDVGQAGNSWY